MNYTRKPPKFPTVNQLKLKDSILLVTRYAIRQRRKVAFRDAKSGIAEKSKPPRLAYDIAFPNLGGFVDGLL